MFILFVTKVLVHFLFEHILEGASQMVLDGVLEILRRLDIIYTDEIAEELTLSQAHLGTALPSGFLRLI